MLRMLNCMCMLVVIWYDRDGVGVVESESDGSL